MPDLWMPQMVLGIHARIRAVIRNAAANQAMHLSREMRRFEMEDLSSRRGDRERSGFEDRPDMIEIQDVTFEQ
jgi:hypothetical protein